VGFASGRRKSGTTRHTVAALALMLAGRAGAEVQDCDWTGSAFWMRGEPAQVERCITAGANIEARSEDGWTPLPRRTGEG